MGREAGCRGAEVGGSRMNQDAAKVCRSCRATPIILAAGKQGNMATSRQVGIPERCKSKKNFLFFCEMRGRDSNLAFAFKGRSSKCLSEVTSVSSAQGSRLTEELEQPGRSAGLL